MVTETAVELDLCHRHPRLTHPGGWPRSALLKTWTSACHASEKADPKSNNLWRCLEGSLRACGSVGGTARSTTNFANVCRNQLTR